MIKSVISFDGTKIYYKVEKGKTQNMLLLHGIGSDSEIWKNEAKMLRKLGFSVIVPDLRGHGRSEKPYNLDAYKLDNFAKDLNAILEKEKVDKAVFIGYSFGGVISVIYYKLFERNVHSMVLVNTDYRMPSTLHLLSKIGFLRSRLYKKKEAKEYLKKKSTDKKVFNYVVRQMRFYSRNFKDEIIELLSKIKVPVLFIEGTADEIVPPKHMEAMCSFIKTAELRKIEAHHNIWLEKPVEVNKCIIDFFRETLGLKPEGKINVAQIAAFVLLGIFAAVLSSPQLLKMFLTTGMSGITGAAVLSPASVQISSFDIGSFIFNAILAAILFAFIYHVHRKW